jgi:hypothetical protein
MDRITVQTTTGQLGSTRPLGRVPQATKRSTGRSQSANINTAQDNPSFQRNVPAEEPPYALQEASCVCTCHVASAALKSS